MKQAVINLRTVLLKYIVVCAVPMFIVANLWISIFVPDSSQQNSELAEAPPINSLTQQDKLPVNTAKQKHLSQVSAAPASSSPAPPQKPPVPTAGNLYARGYCTWYAKHKRPDLPNNLHNANTWVSLAKAQGIPTGTTPRSGAIGQRGMHVVYVEKVNENGTVLISEMNYKGLGIVSSRTAPASSFTYIY